MAYVSYILVMLAYIFLQVPYGALMAVMTGNSQQNTQLTSFRFITAFTGGLLVACLTPDLARVVANGNDAREWQSGRKADTRFQHCAPAISQSQASSGIKLSSHRIDRQRKLCTT